MTSRVIVFAVAVLSWSACAGGEEPAAGFAASGFLPAEEAHQAAAADEERVYAVSSTVVACYDRESGKRLWVSQGPAKHLNSGLLWKGKLYCAHSNFPSQPERSELKAVDLKTRKLETFHDFGDYGGSLTWAVRQQGSWWCNFARYGTANGETFLVRFDDDWRELGRWTYPQEVISDLGLYSLSGGIWWRDSLLVTGHDKPVAYRLQLPKEGNVLELVERLAVPFTGQGIAVDGKTGGLLGISRAQRRVIFARNE